MTAYVDGNPKTKKTLREAVARGERPQVFSPGPFPATRNGVEYVSGPQYPDPHTWHAKVQVEDGHIVKVIN